MINHNIDESSIQKAAFSPHVV